MRLKHENGVGLLIMFLAGFMINCAALAYLYGMLFTFVALLVVALDNEDMGP